MNEEYLEGSIYDAGINDDIFQVWRNSGDIGYVHLAMKVITEAMYDLVLGERDDHISASFFFFGDRSESYYWLWSQLLGMSDGELPDLVKKHRDGYVDQQDLEDIRNLCTVVKTI